MCACNISVIQCYTSAVIMNTVFCFETVYSLHRIDMLVQKQQLHTVDQVYQVVVFRLM